MIRTEPTTTTAARPRCRALGAAGITGAQEKMPPSTPAPFEGGLTGSSSVDRARTGSKHHLLVDAGLPLAVTLAGGNRNDITQLLPLVEGIMPVGGKVGRPRQRPDRIAADRGYDHDTYRRKL